MADAIVSNRFAELLAQRERIERRSISMNEIANATGITRMTLHSYAKNAVTRFDERVIIALCRYFGVGISELLVIDEKTTVQAPA
jgi:transcriptional regulator with XRE-family HTH domain